VLNLEENVADAVNAAATPLARHLGINVTRASRNRIEAELLVRPELCTRPAILHGGAVMAFADTLGAAGGLVTGIRTEAATDFLAPGAPIEGQYGRLLITTDGRLSRAVAMS